MRGSLERRLDRLTNQVAPSIRDVSDAALEARLREMLPRLLNEPGLPDQIRADVLGLLAGADTARSGRLRDFLRLEGASC